MRVAIVNPVWTPSARTMEETLRRFSTLTGWASAVAGAGATVVVHQRFSSPGALEHRGVKYVFVKDGGRAHPSGEMTETHALAESVRAGDPHIVHVNGVIFPQLLRNLRRALPPEIRIVAQDHGGWDPSMVSFWSRYRVRRGLAKADAVLVSSPGHVSEWRGASVVPSRVAMLDVMESSTALQPLPIREARALSGVTGNPAILWVGRLVEDKDPLTMIEGFSLFLNACPDATLSLVYGVDTMWPRVRERIERESRLAARVRVAGAVPFSQMPSYYSAADIYVSASRREGSGYAAIEAMACGAAPVLTDIPSFRVLTDGGRVGALWHRGDPQSLCEALTQVSAQPRQFLRQLVLDRFAAALSWEVLGQRAVAIYREVCGLATGAARA
jgi:glycosyltransferase involved in cell wall biosynthesis